LASERVRPLRRRRQSDARAWHASAIEEDTRILNPEKGTTVGDARRAKRRTHAIYSCSGRGLEQAMKRSVAHLTMTRDDFDGNPDLLGVANGVVDQDLSERAPAGRHQPGHPTPERQTGRPTMNLTPEDLAHLRICTDVQPRYAQVHPSRLPSIRRLIDAGQLELVESPAGDFLRRPAGVCRRRA
jgi:hypothetical protein